MESWTSGSLVAPILLALLVYFPSVALYRLFFHPLAKFPGPKLAAATRWYEAYYDVVQNGRYTFKIAELHAKYGPIVRISPHELHVSDSSFFGQLYRQEGRWNKYDWTYDAFSAKLSSICSVDHELHKRRRAPLNAFFSKATVASRQGIIQARLNNLCARIQEYNGSSRALNLGTVISAFTGDVATEYIIGKCYNNLDRQDFNANMTNVLQSSGAIWRVTKHVRFLGPTMKSLPMPVVEKIGDDGARAFLAFLKEAMQVTRNIMSSEPAQTSTDEPLPTMIHSILQSNLPDAEKSYDRLNDEVSTVLGAALETTAQTLRVVLYYVYNDASIIHRLRAEVASVAGDAEDQQGIPLRTLEQLPFLTAVLMEGLRLSPGLATRMARIAPDRPLVYDKWTIPAGTPVGMTTLLMHTDERLYPDPRHFNPERWMDMETRKKADGIFAPFSRGTRICLGMHLAWAELYMTVAALVQRFDFTFDGAGPKDVVCVSDQFIIGTEDLSGLKVKVSSVKG